jgi:hypothetical protein
MATFSRKLLSGSTSGRPIKVAAVATPGTLIHTAVAGAVAWDEIYAWVSNDSGGAVLLTTEFGGVTDPDDLITKQVSIPANSPPIPILTGQVLNGGLAARMFASVANVLVVTGYVNNIA